MYVPSIYSRLVHLCIRRVVYVLEVSACAIFVLYPLIHEGCVCMLGENLPPRPYEDIIDSYTRLRSALNPIFGKLNSPFRP